MRFTKFICFLIIPLSVLSHCMLDMRLNYEESLDSMINVSSNLLRMILKIKNSEQNLPNYNYNYDILRSITQSYSNMSYTKKCQEKIDEYAFNINQIISNYCEYSPTPITLLKKIDIPGEYEHYEAMAEINNNNFQYSAQGRGKAMVKVFKLIKFQNYSDAQNLWVMLSRVATEVRAGECLLNPMSYNTTDAKYDEILDSINLRTTALSALLMKTTHKILQLDSIVSFDCKFFTPDPSNPNKGINKFGQSTTFYLAYPEVSSNLDTLFFKEPWVLNQLLDQTPDGENDLVLRVMIMIKMVEALSSLHKVGIIHKFIRLSNITYHMFTEKDGSTVDVTLVSFRNFMHSGIDDYDATVSKNFYNPPDNEIEIGPKFDVYQLGISMVQLLFMIASEGTPEMSLSKIAKIINPSSMISISGSQMVLFRKLMFDAVNPPNSYDVYNSYMTNSALVCTLAIFKEIYKYFNLAIYNSGSRDHDIYKEVFYRYTPEDGEENNILNLYQYPKFQKYFTSIFINAYGLLDQCVPGKQFPEDVLKVVRSMLNPIVYRRIDLSRAREILLDELPNIRSSPRANLRYSTYDYQKFVRRNSTGEIFGGKKVINII